MVEWQRAAQECIDYAAQRPQVARECVRLLLEDLRCNIAQSAKRLRGFLIRSNHFGEAKVYELGYRLLGSVRHHDIFQFQITMHDAVIVQVFYSERQLISQLSDAVLTEVEVTDLEVVEEIRSGHVVEDDVVVLTVFEEVDEVDDVGMLAHLEHFNLTSLLENLDVSHVLLFHLFNSYFLAGLFVRGKLYQPELTLAQSLVKGVEVENVRVPHRVLEPADPLRLVLNFREENQARLVRRDH